MRLVSATLAAVLALSAASAAVAAPGGAPTPPPTAGSATLTMEAKAGCGVALVAIDVMAQKFPDMFGETKEEDKKMMQFMMQVMGRQGQIYLDEAFAEGAKRNMTPAQVYTAGVADMLGSFNLDPEDEDAGAEFAALFMGRCLMPGATPTS